MKAGTGGGVPAVGDGGGAVGGGGGLDGGAELEPTVKDAPNQVCVAILTITLPVAAPSGTTTVSKVGLAAMIFAGTDVLLLPANVTTSSVGFALKPLPLTLTTVPARPLFGFSVIVD